jgi:L-lactate dehydrogenase complex protein LldG
MSQAKQNILSRLRSAKVQTSDESNPSYKPRNTIKNAEDRTELLISKLKENHAVVRQVDENNWRDAFIQVLIEEKAKHCLLGQNLEYQDEVIQSLKDTNLNIQITRFDCRYEKLKETLFHDIDISLTLAQGAIADTGTIILTPDENEPRTMSLIPPIHVVLLRKKQIKDDLTTIIEHPPWKDKQNMPSNILFISSPSKTADIQQTLAYGAHGPKKLIVLLVN